MNLATQIRTQIEQMPEGVTFGYADLQIARTSYPTAAKALERLQAKGFIKKLSKGFFYKPKKSVFGELKPDFQEQLRPYLFKNGQRIAYVTGDSLYNQMGLSSQMAFRIKIASRSKRTFVNRGALKADFVKCYATVTETNYELLGLLDAIKDIKQIPDCPVVQALKMISIRISYLNEKQLKELSTYALLYPPRVRALLGAMLENLSIQTDYIELKRSLNPLTKIKLGLKISDLPTKKNWNIE